MSDYDQYKPHLQINVNDRVKVVLPSGYTVRGVVLTANNYNESYNQPTDNWYLEIRPFDGGYCYIKQIPDKAVITKLESIN